MSEASHAEASSKKVGFVSVLHRPAVRTLAASRASSKLAQATVSYGAMVYLATVGGSQWQISLVAASTYLSAVLFGLQGGTLADSLSKRLAIVFGYVASAGLCIAVPLLFGTGVSQLLVIMFLSSALMQVVSPSLKSAVALVSNGDELATVSASISIVGSIASAIGSTLLAPILIKHTSIDVLLGVAGAIYLFGAVRTLRLPAAESSVRLREALGTVDWHPNALSRRATAKWLVNNRAVAAVILVGAIVVSLFEAFNTLIPVYVRDVLNANPADSIYIFAPAAIGFVAGTFLTPKLIGSIGARRLAVISAMIMSISMALFGLVNIVAPILAPISPLRLVGAVFSLDISDPVLAASVIAVPANFGSTAAGAAVQTYINARIPIARQGATFGLQEVQENVFTLGVVLILGVISSVFGSQVVFIVAPIVAFGLVIALVRYSFRTHGRNGFTRRAGFQELVQSHEQESATDVHAGSETPD